MSRFSRQELLPAWNQEILRDARVLVVGAGTTGNEIIKNLALLGIGQIHIIDNDVVEEVNLSRCVLFRPADIGRPKAQVSAEAARALGPPSSSFTWRRVDVIDGVGSATYAEVDCVISAVDNLEARMWLNRYCRLCSKMLIDTGVDGLIGQVSLVPPGSACLECSWGEREYQVLSERHSCSRIGLTVDQRPIPMVVTTAAVVGAIAAQLLVDLLLRRGAQRHVVNDEVLTVLYMMTDNAACLSWTTKAKAECPGHEWGPVNWADVLEVDACQTVDKIGRDLGGRAGHVVSLYYDRDLVYSVSCRQCGGWTEAIEPVFLSRFQRRVCPRCSFFEVVPNEVSDVLRGDVIPQKVGIPRNHLLRAVLANGDVRWVLVK